MVSSVIAIYMMTAKNGPNIAVYLQNCVSVTTIFIFYQVSCRLVTLLKFIYAPVCF
jgi:hypothetical protein